MQLYFIKITSFPFRQNRKQLFLTILPAIQTKQNNASHDSWNHWKGKNGNTISSFSFREKNNYWKSGNHATTVGKSDGTYFKRIFCKF